MISQCASCHKTLKAIAAAALTSFAFAACAHTVLPPQVVPPAPVGTARMPLSVAVLADPSLTLHEPLGFYEKLNPALANAVRDALAADFAKVAVVDDRQSADGADLLAIPATDIHYPSLRQPKKLKLVVTFVEPKTGKTLAELASVKPSDFHAPGAHDHLGADAALLAGALLIPFAAGIFFVEPTLQRHDSERFNAAFSPALIAMATDIAAQASQDKAIESLSIHPAPTIVTPTMVK